MRKPKGSRAEWEQRVEQWRRSGESPEAFAQRHGWQAATLSRWVSRLGGTTREAKAMESTPPRFVEVVERREERRSPGAPVELVLAEVGTLKISAQTDLELVRTVVDALRARS